MKPGEAYSPYRVFLSAPIALDVMAMPNLSPGAKLLFARLALYAGRNTSCYPSLERLACDLGTSTDAIGRSLKELTDAELIRRKRKGPGKTAECEFLWHAALSADSAELRNQDSAKVRNQAPDSAEVRNLDSAEMGGKTPQNRGQDSAETRNHYKEETVHLNGSLKRTDTESAREVRRELVPVVSGDAMFDDGESAGMEAYVGLFLATGKALNDQDLLKLGKAWAAETPDYRRAAFQHAQAQSAQWDGGTFTPFPANHFRNHDWTRKSAGRSLPTARRRTAGEEAHEQAARMFLERNHD